MHNITDTLRNWFSFSAAKVGDVLKSTRSATVFCKTGKNINSNIQYSLMSKFTMSETKSKLINRLEAQVCKFIALYSNTYTRRSMRCTGIWMCRNMDPRRHCWRLIWSICFSLHIYTIKISIDKTKAWLKKKKTLARFYYC